MKSRFHYVRPSTPGAAVEAKARHGDGAVYWAGGTDLVLNWQRGLVRPELCVDLTGLSELAGIECRADAVRIGALTSLTALERSGDRHPLLAALSGVARLMCTPQTRTIATVGGNICNASPAADLMPPLIALDAGVEVIDAEGPRSMPLADFVLGPGRTALGGAQMLTAIDMPPRGLRRATAYRRIDRTVVDIALVGAGAALGVDGDGICREVGLALGAVGPIVSRCPEAEALLLGKPLSALDGGLLTEVGRAAAETARPIDDVRASAGYRRAMAAVMAKRALEDAARQLGGDV